MILIADSGSTKTDWTLLDGDSVVRTCSTLGTNPVHQTDDAISAVFAEARQALDVAGNVDKLRVMFYGAGCIAEQTERMRRLLTEVLLHSAPAESHDSLASRSQWRFILTCWLPAMRFADIKKELHVFLELAVIHVFTMASKSLPIHHHWVISSATKAAARFWVRTF